MKAKINGCGAYRAEWIRTDEMNGIGAAIKRNMRGHRQPFRAGESVTLLVDPQNRAEFGAVFADGSIVAIHGPDRAKRYMRTERDPAGKPVPQHGPDLDSAHQAMRAYLTPPTYHGD